MYKHFLVVFGIIMSAVGTIGAAKLPVTQQPPQAAVAQDVKNVKAAHAVAQPTMADFFAFALKRDSRVLERFLEHFHNTAVPGQAYSPYAKTPAELKKEKREKDDAEKIPVLKKALENFPTHVVPAEKSITIQTDKGRSLTVYPSDSAYTIMKQISLSQMGFDWIGCVEPAVFLKGEPIIFKKTIKDNGIVDGSKVTLVTYSDPWVNKFDW